MGSIEPPFDAASIQSPCVAITARVEAISPSGPAFWLELKKTACGALQPYYKEGEKHKLIQILYH